MTVTHMRPRRLQPQQRREHLLDTAAAMFAEQPYDDVMIQDIAARAGVSRALMYHYFSTVEAINTFGVSAGQLGSFRVVSRRESPCFRSSARFEPGSIPGSSTKEKLARAKSLGQLSFSSTSQGQHTTACKIR